MPDIPLCEDFREINAIGVCHIKHTFADTGPYPASQSSLSKRSKKSTVPGDIRERSMQVPPFPQQNKGRRFLNCGLLDLLASFNRLQVGVKWR